MKLLYFLFGDDIYSITNKKSQIIKSVSESNQTICQMQKKELTAEKELDDFFQEPLNMMLFHREMLLEISLSMKCLKYIENDVEHFIKFLKSLLEQKTIILVLYLPKFDKNLKKQLQDLEIIKKISSFGKVEEYALPKSWQISEIKAYIRKLTLDFKVNFNEAALDLFVECFKDKLGIVPSEISKLQLYLLPDTQVSESIVKNIYFSSLNIDDFCNAIITKKLTKLPSSLSYETTSYSPLYLIAALQNKVRQIYYAKLLSSRGKNSQGISSVIGMHPYRLQKELSLFKNVSLSYLRKVIDALSDIEYKIKSGLIKNEHSLDLLTISVEALKI